ncbi:MAG: MYXO-CTERM sorting domain-containing protein [Myxococcota bacterium]
MSRATLLVVALSAHAALAFCPSYTLSSSNNTGNCGVEAAPGTNPTNAQWQSIFNLVAQGPSVWGSAGPSVSDIGQGCGKPEPSHSVPARFPCELIKAITWRESTWRQFCVPDRPADQVGGAERTIISFDCGYGVGQVTSGMHIGEAPAFDRARVANDATYNLATGMQILAQKWRATRCVGDNQPKVVEHWYSATWAYNGLAYVNNPTNPAYSTTRGVYNPSVGGSAPYQEKVFGAMEYPPSSSHWSPLPFAYPKLSEIGSAGSPNTLSEPNCATPTSCTQTRPTHVSSCFPQDVDGGVDAGLGGGSGSDAGTGGGSGSDAGAGGGAGGGSGRDAGEPQPIVLSAAPAALGPPVGCGCSAVEVPGFAALAALALALRRRR